LTLRHIDVKLIQLKNINKWSKEALIRECLDNNEKAQRHLFESHQGKLFAVCMRYLDTEYEAFDVLNESFLKIFKKLKNLEDVSNLEAWMRRIVVNTALDQLRKNKSYKSVIVNTESISRFENPEDTSDDISDWWESAIRIPQKQLFMEINKLPKASRLVFNLYAIDGIKHKEIAIQLSISESTSRWHLLNAREILKTRLKDIINNQLVNEKLK